MPFLRAFTDSMSQFVWQQKYGGWDQKLAVPLSLQKEVRELEQPRPEPSQKGWAGLDSQTGAVVQEFWRGQDGLHLIVKEPQAAINTVQSLAKPMELVHLSVDNSVSFAYLNKGGGKAPPLQFSDVTLTQMVHVSGCPPRG